MDNMNPVSSWFEVQAVPESYVFPPEIRPGKPVPLCKAIPVIDLIGKEVGDQDHQTDIIRQIMEASERFGLFQVVNHGISEDLIVDAMGVFREFFSMTAEDKASDKSGLIYTKSTGFAKDGVHLWRENFKQTCHPLDKSMEFCPEKPTRYREIVGIYLVEVRELSLRILELISKGLGLEPCFFKDLSELQLLSVNYYPPCPDPSLALGILKHRDPSFITILFQDVAGLQVINDGKWICVEPLPNAFVVNIGNQLQIMSNGRLTSPEHRAVTNSSNARTTISTFINPCSSCVVEPAKALVDASNSPQYSAFLYKDFVNSYEAFGPDTKAILIKLAESSS